MLNQIQLQGRLTKDPVLRYTAAGTPVAGFTLAVQRDSANAAGEKETDFFDCVAWGKTGEMIANTLSKGRLVLVSGSLQTRTYETNEGQRRKVHEIVVFRFYYLDKKPETATADEMGHEVEPDDDIPFDN